jgi:hypothetical protein
MVGEALKGCQTPRVQLKPAEVSSEAADCIDFYHLWGRRLDVWQQNALRAGMGRREDGNWAAFEVGVIVSRQNGKGKVAEPLCLYALFVLGLTKIIYSAHRGDTVENARDSIRELIKANPDLLRRCKPINDSDWHIELLTGQRLEFKTRSGPNGGRGLTADLLILDEALAVKQEQLNAVLPTMTARPYAQIWYTSTVPAAADQYLCRVRQRVLDGQSGVAWAEWTADPDMALTDPANIAQANPGLGRRITMERIMQLRAALGEDGWKTECMGVWPGTAEGAALDRKAFERMRDPTSHRGVDADAVLSIDVTPMLDWGTIGMWALRDDGLEHIQVVDSRPGIDWVPDRAAELRDALSPLAWAIDEKNGAMELLGLLAEVGIAAALDYEEDPASGKLVGKSRPPQRGEIVILRTDDAGSATAQFIQAYQVEVFRWPGSDAHDGGEQAPLKLAVANVKTRAVGDRGQIAWGRRKSTVNIGPVVTVTQCRYTYYTWHDVISSEYDVLSSIPLAAGQCPDCEAWSTVGPIIHYEDCRLARLEVPA